MLDHLRHLNDAQFVLETAPSSALVGADRHQRFQDVEKMTPAQQLDAKKGTLDVFERLGAVDPVAIASEEAQKQSIAVFESFVGSDPKTQLEAVGALTLPESVRDSVAMLTQYQWRFVEQAENLRSMAVSKIVKETDHPDPKIRLQALKLLGSVTEVALFTERVEVKKTDASDEELTALLREKLRKFAQRAEDAKEIDVVEAKIIEPASPAAEAATQTDDGTDVPQPALRAHKQPGK